MEEIIEILKEFGEIAHWTCRPAATSGGNPAFPPIITWRYKEPPSQIAEFFQRVVSNFPGAIPWEFSVVEQTWCLMPSRITEYSKSHDNLGGLAVALELMTFDPNFGKQANRELPLLVEHIRMCMAKAGLPADLASPPTPPEIK